MLSSEKREAKLLGIFRLLVHKNKLEVLAWVKLAFISENSVRKSFGVDSLSDNVCIRQSHNKVSD
jgi:hypothetical protein